MSDKLQTVETEGLIDQEAINQDVETGTSETGAELATASAEEHEETNQEKINAAINKQHAKFREEERKRKEVEAQLEEMRAKVHEYEAPKEPVIPPMPDPYSDNFEAEVKAREEALIAKAKYDVDLSLKAKAEERQQAEQQASQLAKMQQAIDQYNSKAVELGFKPEEINKAGQQLVDNGVNKDVAEFLLSDAEGPLITQYLAMNPIEFDEINQMPPMVAAITIDSKIRQKASALKPKPSNAPDPVSPVSGLGPGEQVPASIKGGRFD